MRRLLLVLIVFVFCSNIKAQKRSSGDIELIPYVGYKQSFFNGGGLLESLEQLTSTRFGVNGDYYFNDRWSLRSGLNYDVMGAKGNSEVRLTYLNIPINANWHFGSTRKWNLNFGITSGFFLDGEENGKDIKNFVNGFQLGISYGIGYKLELSSNFSLMFDLQALLGTSDIIKDDNTTRMNAGSSFNIGGVFKL